MLRTAAILTMLALSLALPAAVAECQNENTARVEAASPSVCARQQVCPGEVGGEPEFRARTCVP